MPAEEPFSNREIKTYFDNFEKSLLRLEERVDERVKPLELELAKMLQWRAGLLGKIAVVGVILAGLWALAVAAVTKKYF